MKWFAPGLLLLCLLPLPAAAQAPVTADAFDPLVRELHAVVAAADHEGLLDLLAPGADVAAARDFAAEALRGGISRAVVAARSVAPDEEDDSLQRLTVEVFTERGDRGRLQTWRLDVTRVEAPGGGPGPWRIASHEAPAAVEGLYHLSLGTDRQFDAGGLEIVSEDLRLRMSRGAVFVSEVDAGITALVLVGRGVLTFSPQPEAERRQIEIFAGGEALEAEFTQAFVRVNPRVLDARLTTALVETPVDRRTAEQAQAVFDDLARRTFVADLGDVSDRTWWLTPQTGNFVAEVVTREHGALTYTQADQQPEDISLFTRDPARVIALYPSAHKRATQGRYYDRRAAAGFDVLDYDIEASFEPRGVGRESLGARPTLLGCWIDATVRLALRVGDRPLRSLTLQLNQTLRVHSVTSRELGALLFFRLSGRNDIVINLPAEAPAGEEFTLLVRYTGLLEADELEENWIGRMRLLDRGATIAYGIPERRYLYTNASRWYPQPAAADYATATMTLTVPADYGVVASGDPDDGNPPLEAPPEPRGTRTFSFVAVQPARYLSCVITRFTGHETPSREIVLDRAGREARPGVSYDSLSVAVEANAFGREHVPGFAERTARILRFYASLVGDVPYPTFTLTLTDSRLPGGHSPAYFVVLNQPLPVHGRQMRTWRTDPVAFSGYPSFFLAHELAHQWWGQAVGWKNYHEQWLSEGLAQYFAALWAREAHGEEAFVDVLSQLRRWSLRHSDQGPVYLGYRLGHLAGEPRVFRALVYNKSALVLHMLRRLIGDDAFFRGLRRFYTEMRFRVAGTDDLIRAFEVESARPLENFFQRWIHEFELPALRFGHRTETRPGGADVVLRFEQQGTVFELPVTVTLAYRSGEEESVVVAVTEAATEVRVPLRGPLRDVHVNRDHAALAEIRR